MQQYIELRITAIRTETADVKSFVLERTDGKLLSYKPGQFITLVFPGRINEERRSYSISSIPGEPLCITVKRIDNGEFSRYLFDVCKIGSSLYTLGASGFFTLPEALHLYEQIFFLAAGSGVTPILPLIKSVLFNNPALKIHLIYSNHDHESAIFLDELEQLQQRYRDVFNIELLFSNNKNLLRARLSKMLLVDYVRKYASGDKSKTLFYYCGPHSYMQMVGITLLTEGVPVENLRKEIFDTIKPIVREQPPDEERHAVTILLDGEEYHFDVQYPETILQGAKAKGIVLPYSCEAGKCGTCSATCTQGEVWMSYNEVLLDKELKQGRVLTCTGHPVHGDIILQFPALAD